MPYYAAGDYYPRGDYYRGDFLGIGSFLKRVALPFAESLPGIGTVVKGVEAGVNLIQSGSHPNLPRPAVPSIQQMSVLPAGLALPQQPQRGIVNVGAGPQTGLINIGMDPGLPAGRTMRGFHPNKSTYETRGGGTSRWGGPGLELHPKGSVLVRNRRMNVGNARALKRALRRAHGFARLARRVMSFTHPRAGRGHFKFKRRKRA